MAKVKCERPDGGTLAKLLHACRDHDMDGAYEAMTVLTRYEYHYDGELVEWLQGRMDQFKLKDIAKRLASMDI
jgi:hypothetical protein